MGDFLTQFFFSFLDNCPSQIRVISLNGQNFLEKLSCDKRLHPIFFFTKNYGPRNCQIYSFSTFLNFLETFPALFEILGSIQIKGL